MVDTEFYVPEAKLARLVDSPPGGRDALWDVTKRPKLFAGGGGLVSTAVDYMRFCQMLLNGGELDGVRILSERAVQLMTVDSLPQGIRFALDMIGPKWGASWGLGFAIRTNAASSAVPGAVGSLTWGGVWGTMFWIDRAEKLIAILMIQVKPGEANPYREAFRNLTYAALRVPEDSTLLRPARPLSVGATTLADYVGTYDFGASVSSRDKQLAAISEFVGTGVQVIAVNGVAKVSEVYDGAPAAKAGVQTGDVITHLDGVSVKGLTPEEVSSKMRGRANSELRVTIERKDKENPIDLTIARERVRVRTIELRVELDSDQLVVTNRGRWPILDFDRGRPVTLLPISNAEFCVESGDHTRIAFVTDTTGRVTGAVLNPGPFQQKGDKIDSQPSARP